MNQIEVTIKSEQIIFYSEKLKSEQLSFYSEYCTSLVYTE